MNKKKIYKKKNPGELVGVDIKPQYPKNPTIILNNFFKFKTDKLSKILIDKINNLTHAKKKS